MDNKNIVYLNKNFIFFVIGAFFLSSFVVFLCEYFGVTFSGTFGGLNTIRDMSGSSFFGNYVRMGYDFVWRMYEDYWEQQFVIAVKCLIADYKVVLCSTGILSLLKFISMKVTIRFD